MPLLETRQQEYEEIGPKVSAADEKILAALDVKNDAADVYAEAKAAVKELKAVRDPLRIEQMQLANAIGNVDGSPPAQAISNGSE